MGTHRNRSLVLVSVALIGINALAVVCSLLLTPPETRTAVPIMVLAMFALTVVEFGAAATLFSRFATEGVRRAQDTDILRGSQSLNRSHGVPQQMGSLADVLRLTHTRDGLASNSGEIRAELLEHAFSTVPYRVFWKDANSVYLGCNQNFLKDIGASAIGEVVGKTDFDMPWKSIGQECQADDREVLDSGIPKFQYEVQIEGADGDLRWLLVSKVPIRDRGRVIGVLGSYDNITSRKLAEQERDTLRGYLREVFDSMPSALIGVDPQGRITEWNAAAERLTGTPADRACGASLRDVFSLLPDAMPALLTAIAGHRSWSASRVAAKALDRSIRCDVMVYPLSGGKGAVIRVDDVTELALKEEQLRQAQKMESIGQLAGGLAHDFNNSLVGIRGGLALMRSRLNGQETVESRQVLEVLDLAERGANDATDMVQRLLTISRKQVPSFADVDLRVAVQNVMRICETTFPKHIELVTQLDAAPLVVHADRVQLEQALLNLALNAADAMTPTQLGTEARRVLTVSAGPVERADLRFFSHFPEGVPGDYVALRVSDTGVGMNADTQKKIFDPFFTTKSEANGTGLGLTMVDTIVKHHQGAVDVVSAPGQGTTVTLYFTREVGAAATAEVTPVSQSRAGNGLVLVADDHENVRKTLGFMLQDCGYRVLYACDGEEAIRLVREQHAAISAVILDMAMPKLSGKQAFLAMREIAPDVNVLISSGRDIEHEVQETLALGARGFLRKPFAFSELTMQLEAVAAQEAMRLSGACGPTLRTAEAIGDETR